MCQLLRKSVVAGGWWEYWWSTEKSDGRGQGRGGVASQISRDAAVEEGIGLWLLHLAKGFNSNHFPLMHCNNETPLKASIPNYFDQILTFWQGIASTLHLLWLSDSIYLRLLLIKKFVSIYIWKSVLIKTWASIWNILFPILLDVCTHVYILKLWHCFSISLILSFQKNQGTSTSLKKVSINVHWFPAAIYIIRYNQQQVTLDSDPSDFGFVSKFEIQPNKLITCPMFSLFTVNFFGAFVQKKTTFRKTKEGRERIRFRHSKTFTNTFRTH